MWIILFSWCTTVSFVMILVLCICWRKKTITEDWHGLDGMVTQKNPDENVNHLPSVTTVVDGINSSGDCSNSNKRNITNSRRSLPDIPSEQATNINWDPTDNSSEHYATVGQYPNSGKRHTIANGIENDENVSPYERVKYDKINSNEHPYAQLQPNVSRQLEPEENRASSEERINLLRTDANPADEPSSPIISRRSSSHSVGLDIPAASAVAGVVAASPELPYMTPPVTQANFSGDSQDSSKGYTSISVREPLANILAQTNEMIQTKPETVYPHYSTVSDDSDDVYTTIPDPNNPVYNSESETYARIPSAPITVEVEVNAPPPARLQIQQDVIGDETAPQPPPVDSLKQVMAQNHTKSRTHSRQGSSSSSIANLGSPKPEKRQVNSPLPPPPTNVDDLYAKVHKNKKEETAADQNDVETIVEENTISINVTRSSLGNKIPQRRYKNHDYETLKKSARRTSDPGYEKIRDEPGYASIAGPESIPNSDAGYEIIKNRSEEDPNYEELRHRVSNASDSSAYTKIKDLNDGYSVVKKDEPNYESMRGDEVNYDGSKSNSSESDPNYESVKDLEEPPYERLEEDSSRTNSDRSGSDRSKKKESDINDTSESSSSIGKSSSDKTDLPPYELLNNDTELFGYEKIGSKLPSNHDTTNIHDEDAIFQV
ncbi:uncharacterized protein LOC130898635 [Diorhabda carinulata]|uniref:uncharacterized protein LOC130898635 n=1 Tax=Diorhabda carinulata TaxID=1163345 RepID=UPI0025A14961|nr:uncharacterized protein LOC130898635 [Diorhabda carinulata]